MNIEDRENETRIIALNANGFPSNKANQYKLKNMNKLMENNDILVAIETGINDNSKPKRISDEHEVNRINY